MATKENDPLSQASAPPQLVLDQAQAAVKGQIDDESRAQSSAAEHHTGHREHHHGTSPNLDHVPPPAYNGAQYGQLDISQNGMDTGAKIGKDGRVNIKINARSHKLSDLLVPALRRQLDLRRRKNKNYQSRKTWLETKVTLRLR